MKFPTKPGALWVGNQRIVRRDVLHALDVFPQTGGVATNKENGEMNFVDTSGN